MDVPLWLISHLRFRWLAERMWFNRGFIRRIAAQFFVAGRLLIRNFTYHEGQAQGRFLREILVEKHLACWRTALDGGFNLLVVLEDDAIENNNWNLPQTLVPRLTGDEPMFVNLGGGNNLSLYPLTEATDIGLGWRRGRLADTAVAYCVNRAGLDIMANSVAKWPHGRRVGADAMISGVLLRNLAVDALFPPQPFFLNGTIEGFFDSELPTSKVHKMSRTEQAL